jgi:hypothetical protein
LVGEWLHQSFPPNTLMAINAAGIVPYLSGLRTLDMLGLNDEHIAHRQMTLGLGVSGHEKHDATYVLSRKPDIILLGLPTLAPRFVKQDELEHWVGRFFQYLPGDSKIYHSEEFRRSYLPVSVAIDERYFVFFRRVEASVHARADVQPAAAHWPPPRLRGSRSCQSRQPRPRAPTRR